MAFFCPTCEGKGLIKNGHILLRVSFKINTSKDYINKLLDQNNLSLAIVSPNPVFQSIHQFYIGLSGNINISVRIPEDKKDYWSNKFMCMPEVAEVTEEENRYSV